MDWPSLVKKYVWDEQRTPYFVAVDRLTPAQARSELFVYAFCLAILSAVVAAVAVIADDRRGAIASPVVALYALILLAGAIVLAVSGHPVAAGYCATAPVVVGLAAALGVLRPDMAGGERVLLTALSVAWLGYAARVVRIARRLHDRT
ncbi:MAG: hypothetical protein ACREJG_08490 [Candidatus Rokuibacteriota bacterium]